jgi:hypothetical protein
LAALALEQVQVVPMELQPQQAQVAVVVELD